MILIKPCNYNMVVLKSCDTIFAVVCYCDINIELQVASLASLAQLLPPSFAYVSNLVPDSSLCRAAAPRLHPLHSPRYCINLLHSPRYCINLLHSPRYCIDSLQLPDCVRIGCCYPIASASTVAPRLRPLRLLLLASCSGRFQPMPNVLETFFAEFEVQ